MGYSTDFSGHFTVDKPVDDETLKLLVGLSTTRRMKRKVDPSFGVEGEFFIAGKGFAGQDRDDTIIDYNKPPATQPSLWCQWLINEEDRQTIAWDGGEKFYNYIEWIEYIANRILAPRGYLLSGSVTWQGEDRSDVGKITIKDNKVFTAIGKIAYNTLD